VEQNARQHAQPNYLSEPISIPQIPHARHHAQQWMNVVHAHGNPWDSPSAPAGLNNYVPYHHRA